MFHYESSQNSTYLTNSESISLWYFVMQFFTAGKNIYDPPKASISDTKQIFKDGDLSELVKSLWGRSWLSYESSDLSDF